MKRAIIAVVVGAVAVLTIVVVIQKHARDPETSNPADLEYEKAIRVDAHGLDVRDGEAPEFFVSDPTLLVKTPHVIEAQMTDQATGKSLSDAPYFIELADGRYAFGYADSDGRTRSLFTQAPVKYTVFWYDDAWEHWDKRRAASPDARH